ncbi:hypothetical protein RIF29_19181 [Crotalaria pallida]|uniref:Uncharacterized protein n=1 Tax=Crotalaria pallida TaxID=3830 RepID=A0AAN9F3F7_CROPI
MRLGLILSMFVAKCYWLMSVSGLSVAFSSVAGVGNHIRQAGNHIDTAITDLKIQKKGAKKAAAAESSERGRSEMEHSEGSKTESDDLNLNQSKRRKIEESDEKVGVLCLHMYDGVLIGIDLDAAPTDDTSICFVLDFLSSGFPICMRHVQIDHQHLFVGGVEVESSQRRFSNQIHEFRPSSLLLNPPKEKDILVKKAGTLACPKLALVANLQGDIYLLHHYGHPSIPVDPKPDVPFERFDRGSISGLKAPIPPIYGSIYQKFETLKLTEEPRYYIWPESWFYDPNDFPVECQFVVDNKLLLFCHSDRTLQIFTTHTHEGEGEWETFFRDAEDVRGSFLNCRKVLPSTALCLSDLVLFQGQEPYAVFLGIIEEDCKVDSSIPSEYASSFSFRITQKLYAFPLSKTTFEVNCFQDLDEVFSIRGAFDPLNPLDIDTVSHQLLDLGDVAAGNGYPRRRRVCAISEGNGYTDKVPYAFISIFDLHLTQKEIKTPDDPKKSCKFLNVSMVKKHLFKLEDKKKESIFDAFILTPGSFTM